MLKQIFGKPATVFIYKYLEEEHSLRRQDITNELKTFSEGLKNYLSNSGASMVLGTIIDEGSKLELKNAGDRNFFEQLKELKSDH